MHIMILILVNRYNRQGIFGGWSSFFVYTNQNQSCVLSWYCYIVLVWLVGTSEIEIGGRDHSFILKGSP